MVRFPNLVIVKILSKLPITTSRNSPERVFFINFSQSVKMHQFSFWEGGSISKIVVHVNVGITIPTNLKPSQN